MMAKILKPGDPEYNNMLSSITTEDLQLVRNGLAAGDKQVAITWEKRTLKEGYMEYATLDLTETKAKIVFHFIKLSQNLMCQISDFFRIKICGPIITIMDIQDDVYIEAGQNPLFRSNWDFVAFNFNKFRASGIMRLIASKIVEEFRA